MITDIQILAAQRAPASPLTYTRIAVVLHWLTAAFILLNIALGLNMEYFPGYAHSSREWNAVLFWHGSIGAVVLWLAVARWIWRTKHPAPELPDSVPAWQALVAHGVHVTLYALMILLPLTGYVHRITGNHPVSFFGLWDWPSVLAKDEPLRLLSSTVHLTLALLLGGLLLAHVGAVLKHKLIDRDGVAQRMTWR